MPHRSTALLLDRVLSFDPVHRNATASVLVFESLFDGHFPGDPIMPGVFVIEAMAQLAGVLAQLLNLPILPLSSCVQEASEVNEIEGNSKVSTLLTGIDGVRWYYLVRPWDFLTVRVEMLKHMNRGIVAVHGKAYVNETVLACTANSIRILIKLNGQ